MSKNIYFIALTAAISGLLFGFDAGIISGALLFIKQSFVLTPSQIGIIVSCVPIGALISSIISGRLSDWLGRKITLFLTAVFFLSGSLLCAFAANASWLVIGRIIIGLAIGVGSCIAPVYVAELAARKQRGWLVNLFVVAIQLGVFLAFVISYVFSYSGNWRLMIGLGIVPAIVLAGCSLILPESPRWLIVKQRYQQAHHILIHMFNSEVASKEVENIKNVVHQDAVNIKGLFQKRYFKVLFIGIVVSFFTQTVGINAINYYAPTIFQHTGFASPSMATFATMFIGLMLVLSTISSLFFIDKWGRRIPLLLGMIGILFSLLIITLAFAFLPKSLMLGWLMFIGSVIFMLFHGLSIGPACFLIPAEVFPAKIRGMGMGLAVAFNWGANVIIAYIIPIVIARYGVSQLFAGFFLVSVVGWLVFYYFVPDTKGISLEQIELNIKAGFKSRHLGKLDLATNEER